MSKPLEPDVEPIVFDFALLERESDPAIVERVARSIQRRELAGDLVTLMTSGFASLLLEFAQAAHDLVAPSSSPPESSE